MTEQHVAQPDALALWADDGRHDGSPVGCSAPSQGVLGAPAAEVGQVGSTTGQGGVEALDGACCLALPLMTCVQPRLGAMTSLVVRSFVLSSAVILGARLAFAIVIQCSSPRRSSDWLCRGTGVQDSLQLSAEQKARCVELMRRFRQQRAAVRQKRAQLVEAMKVRWCHP